MKQPNILWYCTDQQRFDTIGVLGNQYIHTPRLDAFAETAVAFTRAYAQSPVCTPSRASFLTGCYPSALSVNSNGIPRFPEYFADRLITNRLAAEGYDCGLVGKLHIASAYGRREARADDGYRYFRYSHDHKGPDLPEHAYAHWIRERGHDPHEILASTVKKDEYRSGGRVDRFSGLYQPTEDNDTIPPDLHQTHWCTEASLSFIEENRRNSVPWLLSINPFDPHPPFDAPFEYFRRYDPDTLPGSHFKETDLDFQKRLADAGIDFQTTAQDPEAFEHKIMQASYYAMIEQLDYEFGRLLDYLDASGQRENTIVIFMSDHGEALGDHGLRLKGCRFYEGSMRVPLLISWPAGFKGGHQCDDLVELTDIVPTIYDLAGLAIPDWVQGRSLAPVLRGQHSESAGRSHVRAEAYDVIDFPDNTEATMYCDGTWKLVTYHGKGIHELYNLAEDPWEHNDLSEDSAYAGELARLIQESFDSTVKARPPQEPRIAPY